VSLNVETTALGSEASDRVDWGRLDLKHPPTSVGGITDVGVQGRGVG
jgi:hypothetical protein